MRPLTVITGVFLGSSVSIAVSLLLVLVVVLVIGREHPRLADEFEPLVKNLAIFVGMTAVTAGSFYTQVKRHRFRVWLQALMWGALAATGWYYWPS